VEAAIVQHGLGGIRHRSQPRPEAKRVGRGAEISIAAPHQLGAALQAELPAGLGAHPPAGLGRALQHLHLVAGAAQLPGTGEARHPAPHHHDRRHA
jgi:hypothetical protein